MLGRRCIDCCTVGKHPDTMGKQQLRGRVAPNTGKMSMGLGKMSTGLGKKQRRSIGMGIRLGTNRQRPRGNRKLGSTTVVGTVRSCTTVAVVGMVDKSLKNETEPIILSRIVTNYKEKMSVLIFYKAFPYN